MTSLSALASLVKELEAANARAALAEKRCTDLEREQRKILENRDTQLMAQHASMCVANAELVALFHKRGLVIDAEAEALISRIEAQTAEVSRG